MKKTLLFSAFSLFMALHSFSQTDKAWKIVKTNDFEISESAKRNSFPSEFKLVSLNLDVLNQTLRNAPDRADLSKSSIIISIPNSKGELERFEMYEASNFDAALQAQFPEIRSYVGVGIDDKYARLRLSIDPSGINTMVNRANKATEFMEPYSADRKVYAVYDSSRRKGKLPFTCSTPEQALTEDLSDKASSVLKSSTGELLTFRLAMSVTPEYTTYHHGLLGLATPKTSALSAINTTMTRVNGVFETDFAIHMNLINNMTIIYDGSVADPYGATDANYNSELANTLNTVVGNANYDVGHLMGNVGNNGNAGCIGCVCSDVITDVDGDGFAPDIYKGSGYTTSTVPVGDAFDIDFVAHELGHQFGANHTFSMSNEGTGVNMEVGSGVTIMGYAGITGQDTHAHSIDVFHAASIAQVQANMAGKACPTRTPITHSAPVVEAGANYTIPQLTPFVLTGSATDAGGSGALTYTWEQYNNASGAQTGAASAASATKATGPNWTNYQDSSEPVRYFPVMSTIMNNSTTTAGIDVTAEALSSVNRSLAFRLTARDNVVGQGQTNFDNMTVTVDASKGPLTVTSQNTTGISYDPSSVQTVTWNVNNTNTIAGGANVDVLITTDNGVTWTSLATNLPNNGSASITMPSTPAPFCRLMVKANGNIFFNVNTQVFSVGYTLSTVCNTYSNNTPLVIPDGAGNNVSGGDVSKSIVTSGIPGVISDVNVHVTSGHTYFWDLNVTLTHTGEGSSSSLLARNCNNSTPNGFDITFDDAGGALVCTNPVAGTYVPTSALSVFNDKNPNTTWTITANDNWGGDTGNIDTFEIEICTVVPTLSANTFENIDNLVLYPNPNNGTFSLQFKATSNDVLVNVHDIRGRNILSKEYAANGLFSETINLQNAQSGIYLVTIQDGAKKVTKKIVVE